MAGDAAKLVGRLSFGAQHIFRKLGRVMLRPIYMQQHAPLPHGRINESLRLALLWWKNVPGGRTTRKQPMAPREQEQVELFCDARGQPAKIAAVLSL